MAGSALALLDTGSYPRADQVGWASRLVAESGGSEMDLMGRIAEGRRAPGWLLPRGAAALIGALGILWVSAPTASAATTPCTTTISSGTITGNVSVPANSTCILYGVTVTGNVAVAAGATFRAAYGTLVTGALTAAGAAAVQVYNLATVAGAATIKLAPGGSAELYGGATIGGSLTINGGARVYVFEAHVRGAAIIENTAPAHVVGPAVLLPPVFVENTTFGGSLTVIHNGLLLDIEDNQVGGVFAVTANTGGTDGIFFNRSAGVLSCSANTAPFDGGQNTAPGKLGQCSTF
jgi:hypothetical protein